MKLMSAYFEESYPIHEGVFDDQDDKIAIKSPSAPLWGILKMNDHWKTKIDYKGSFIRDGIISISLKDQIVCNYVTAPGELEKYYPGFKGITSTGSTIEWYWGESQPFRSFDEHMIGSEIDCSAFQVASRSLKNVNITIRGTQFSSRTFSFGTSYCQDFQNVSVTTKDDGRSVGYFCNLDSLPVFKNCHIELNNINFYDPQLLHDGAKIFEKLFDFSKPAQFILKDETQVKSPTNFKKLIAYLRNPKKYEAYSIKEAYFVNPDTTLKDLGLDIGYKPDAITFKENGLILCMVNYKDPVALNRFAPTGKVANVLPLLRGNLGTQIDLAYLVRCPGLKTKEGYLVFFISTR